MQRSEMNLETDAGARARTARADILDDLILDDRKPAEVTKAAIVGCLEQVASEHGGTVAIPWIRPHLPQFYHPQTVGATMTGLVRSGCIRWTGAFVESQNHAQRNGKRPAKVYELLSTPDQKKASTSDIDLAMDKQQTRPKITGADLHAMAEPSSDYAYQEFILNKARLTPESGFDVDPAAINPMLFPHQRDIVQWACKGGNRAIFAAFGLGKSFMQFETLRLCLAHEGPGARGLIVCPLGVRQEFMSDAAKLGIEIRFVRRDSQVEGPGLYLTNYESIREGNLDPALFDAVSLDEASVLRSFGSKTYQTFLPLFADVKYRFVATATPSPNRYKELIHYAGFLGVMDTGQALTRFFKRDSTQANNLTLYPHKEAEFWLWLHSWAIFLQKPSDLGYSDDGYVLPELDVRWHKVAVDQTEVTVDRDGQAHLYRDSAIGLQDAAREKRDSIDVRVERAREIVSANPDDHFILWHDLEAERHAIKKALPEAVEVYGSQDLDLRERRIVEFSDGESRLLATKPVIAGSGCNFQRHCHRAIFVGVGFKFNDFIQAVHRIHRFLQTEQVIIDIIYAESEAQVVQTLKNKWVRHDELTGQMAELIREHGLGDTGLEDLARSSAVERVAAQGEGWYYANNDTVAEARLIEDNSVDLIVTSIPFANHYEYTPSYLDFGHTDDNDHFWKQMDFLTPELLRILAPGRIYACHVKDRINFGNTTGAGIPTVSPFHMEAAGHAMRHGFDYMGMITVVTDVVRENNQTYRLGWSENAKDGSKMGVGSPEYVLLFHKPQTDRSKGFADTPIMNPKDIYSRARWQIDAHAFWRSSGNRHLTPDELADLPVDQRSRMFTAQTLAEPYDYADHVATGEVLDEKGALPATFMSLAPGSWHPMVWHDVNRMLTLNTSQSQRAQVQHVCPLQFDIVDRLIERFSNPGEWVYDPFGGLGTVPVRALKAGRKGRGVELNPDYYRDALTYLKEAEIEANSPDLFAMLEGDAGE